MARYDMIEWVSMVKKAKNPHQDSSTLEEQAILYADTEIETLIKRVKELESGPQVHQIAIDSVDAASYLIKHGDLEIAVVHKLKEKEGEG